jgi:hypothetical protein
MHNNISTWLKPLAAARRLGVSPSRLRQLADAGELASAKDFHGALRFDPYPIEQMRRRLDAGGKQIARQTSSPRAGDGKAHAKAFRMFEEGRPSRDVVIECELTATAVVELRRQYAELGRDFLVSASGLAELRDVLDWRGEATEANLLAAIQRKVRESFERGQMLAAEPDKHTIEEETSGKPNGRAKGGGGGAHAEIEATLRGDLQEQPSRGPRARDPG